MREFEIRVVIRGSNQQQVVMGHFGWFWGMVRDAFWDEFGNSTW